MPRKRMVSPELLSSESVASLPIATRYALIGLWMYLDDEGRGKDNASLIRAHQWPLDDTYTTRKVAADLTRMATSRPQPLICRYLVAEQSFLHVPSWSRWQKINHPSPSRIPLCPVELAGLDHEGLPEDSRSLTGVLREDYGRTPGGLPRNVVEVSSIQSSSSGDPSDQPLPGSDGMTAARQAVESLRQRGRIA